MNFLISIFFLCNSVFVGASKVPFFLNDGNKCGVTKCNKSEPALILPLSKSIHPCENFYEFSCSEWTAQTKKPPQEVLWNRWTSASEELHNRELKILKSNEGTDSNLIKAQTFYRACLDADKSEAKHLRSLKILVKELCGGWPLLNNDFWSGHRNFDWLKEVSKLTRVLGIFPILKIHVDMDYSDPTHHVLYIEPGHLIYPKYILTNTLRYKKELRVYENWIYSTIEHLYQNKGQKKLREEVRKVVELEIMLARLRKKSKKERMSVQKLSERFPLSWSESLNILFEGVDGVQINGNDTVVVRNYAYLKMVLYYFRKQDKKVIANYLIWTVVKDLSRQASKYLRYLNFLVDKAILGVQSDLSRSIECVTKVNEYLGHTITSKYIEQYLRPETLDEVEEMVKNVKAEFLNLIQNSQWLSQEAKNLSVQKVKNIRHFIGFPEWSRNDSVIVEYDKSLHIDDNHLLNILRVKGLSMARQLRKLREPVTEEQWPSTVFDVNAYYSILQNAVFIPLGLLLPPFYQSDRLSVYNYGALGTLIGHEFSHSLDISGLQADIDGKIRKWWPSDDIRIFHRKTKCFQDQYRPTRMNNFLTLSENIADSVGLDISLAAYRKLKGSRPELLRDSGEERLFFISFAQMWCEIPEKPDIFSEEEHAPVKDRVNLTVSNSEEFSMIYDCVANTNRDSKSCKLW